MNIRTILPARMGHHDCDVIAGVTDEKINQQLPVLALDAFPDNPQDLRTRESVAADGADVCFDDAHRDPHTPASCWLGDHSSTSGRANRPLLGTASHAAFARSLPVALHSLSLTHRLFILAPQIRVGFTP